MSETIRNRIKGHRRVRAGDLVPHEWNFRVHPPLQRSALAALYREVGFARSLLAYELPDGRLKLIDGHLRRELDPDLEVDVEVLDVNDVEARMLLLSIDPLAELAQINQPLHDRAREITPTAIAELDAAWNAARQGESEPDEAPTKETAENAQYLILVQCRDEPQQVELLERFAAEGLECTALVS